MNFSATDGAPRQGRLAGLAFVAVLHVLLFWGLASGLARKTVELLPAPLETQIIEDRAPPEESPPPPVPEFAPPPPPFIPPPDIHIATPPPAPAAITRTVAEPPPPAAPAAPPPPRRADRVPPRLDLGSSPRACREPEYPAASERLGEQGTSAISLMIGVDGKVQQSRVDASSGYERLDQAAVRAFSRCRFFVGTVDGRPEASWFSIRYRWVVP